MRCSRGDRVMYPEEDSECWQDEGHRQGCNQTCHVEESQGPRAEVASGLDLNLWRAVVCSGPAHGLGRAGWVWGKCYPACCHCWLGLVYGVHMGEGWYHPRHAAPPQHMTSPNLNRGSAPHPTPCLEEPGPAWHLSPSVPSEPTSTAWLVSWAVQLLHYA